MKMVKKMKVVTIEQSKKIQLDILLAVHEFCLKNHLSYYLTFGTLIGAIRHNGFIPWDDDIDIFMPRGDYEKFISSFKADNYQCYSLEKDKKYPFPYAKVVDTRTIKEEPLHISKKIKMGIDIDVFPLSFYYEEDYKGKIVKKWNHKRRLWYQATSKFNNGGLLKSILLFPVKLFLRPFTRSIAFKISNLTNPEANGREPLGYITGTTSCDDIFLYPFKWFEKPMTHLFENHELFIPCGYDELLKMIYGDYMTPPPPDKCVPIHGYPAYLKDEE